ncbi:MAG TPA: hypothetical protein VE131_10575 [Terriglobales bacterium]|nr:hypothetical protein [Terriglobales bacterium]
MPDNHGTKGSLGISRDIRDAGHKIAIFQYEWPLQVHTLYLAGALAASGYEVELFLKGCPSEFVNRRAFAPKSGVWVFDFPNGSEGDSLYGKIRNRTIDLLTSARQRLRYFPIQDGVVEKSLTLLQGRYQCFIGVEKKGLIWASKAAASKNAPYLYYSLELYLEDHPTFENTQNFKLLRNAEIMAHRGAKATIIQDEARAEVLFRHNDSATDIIIFPISLPNRENQARSDFLQTKYDISERNKIILYFGMLGEGRLSTELAKQKEHMPPNTVLVLHGQGDKKFLTDLRRQYHGGNLIVSCEMIPEEKLPDLIASAHIGLAFYRDSCSNDRLSAFSSEKVAMYLREGLPVVSFNIGNYPNLVHSYRCGELIDKLEELPSAVTRIFESYDKYSKGSSNAFRDLFHYQRNFVRLEKYIRGLRSNER